MWPFRNHGYGEPCKLKGGIPFSGRFSSLVDNGNNRNRLRQFRDFMGWEKVPEGLLVLDIGAPNFIGQQLGITHFTGGDLNVTMRTKLEQYDTITCFEVLNHVMNHLDFLRRIHGKLKPGGSLYLSTPKQGHLGLAWTHGLGNYCELSTHSLRQIVKYAGFEIVRHEIRNPWPLRFIFYGIRPPFRWIFNRYQLLECRKI